MREVDPFRIGVEQAFAQQRPVNRRPRAEPTLSRPLDSTSTVARSSASRNGFSYPIWMTAAPNPIRVVRWLAAARNVAADETARSRWRCRIQAPS